MSHLSGKVIAVAVEGEVAVALARRLARDGACVVIGSPPSAARDEAVAELRWECAAVAWRPLDLDHPDALGDLAAAARESFGALEAIVSGGGAHACDQSGQPALAAERWGARRLIRVGEADDGDEPASDGRSAVTRISAEARGCAAVDPESVAGAVAFALASPADISAIVLRA